MPSKPPSFKISLSYQNRAIAFYYGQIEQQQRLLKRIQSVLPDNLAQQAKHCLIKERKLLIYTDSATWASQIRFYSNVIIGILQATTQSPIETMQVRLITTQIGSSSGSSRKANIPSVEKIALIRRDSLSVSDAQLQQALLKLSATLDRLSNINP
ncbi:MAG: DUF721 domain-containing protein [Methylococcales bacterium]|nr:MAG: DUF721 domain-containing protein [Methylococcales bacterium]